MTIIAPLIDTVIVNSISAYGQHFSRAASIMTCFWIFAAIVIATCYKSIMRANYVFEDKYMTRWRSFKEMENFTFIYADGINEEFYCKMITDAFQRWKKGLIKCKTESNSYDQKCILSQEHLCWQPHCFLLPETVDERFACEVFYLFHYAKYFCTVHYCPFNERFKEWMKERASLLQNMASNGRVRPFSRIRDVIREELLEPRNACVPRTNFWQ